ncbi:MAG: hypothetical protein RL653_774 [Pseudomonadota bacterium]|jgi:hypothetical protein
MIPSALLLLLLAHSDDPAETRAMDQAAFAQAPLGAALDWSDAEDRVKATVLPGEPVAGKPLRIDLQVGSFQGPAYDGPVVLQLRPPDASSPVVSVPLEKQAGGWAGSATPERPGEWTVDVRFRTTRNKHVQAPLVVKAGFVVPWAELVIIVLIAGALASWLYRATASNAPPAPATTEPSPPEAR